MRSLNWIGKVGPVFLLVLIIPSVIFAWPGKVVHIKDGDTIVVLKDRTEIDVRLYGIDTPEKGQPFGKKAKRFTSSLAGGQMVEVVTKEKDRYGRTVALVYIEGDGECLNEELVRNGYAWVYERYCHIRDCDHWQELERQARSSGIGLWSRPNPIPPWDWRHGDRNQGASSSSCSSGKIEDKDCSDFSSQAESQRFFEVHPPRRPYRLDDTGDGVTYEGL